MVQFEEREVTRVVTPEKKVVVEEPLGLGSWQYIFLQTTAGLESVLGGGLFLLGSFRFMKNKKGKEKVVGSIGADCGVGRTSDDYYGWYRPF